MSLPSPVLTRRPFRRESKRTLSVDVLLSRSRITNLAVVLLAGITALSLLVNLSYWLSSPSSSHTRPFGNSIFGTISRPRALQGLSHLVIVPGHAIWEGTDASARLDEDNWVLEPYQRDGGRVETFFQHIARGAEIVRKDESALLVFSGGQTRAASTLTEAESYLRLALAADVFKTPMYSTQPFLRATTENHALDSYQNLLFSVARFHEYTGNYPRRITVVGYGMKEERFRKLHRMAIRWPENAFEYVGVDPAGESNALARQGETEWIPSLFQRPVWLSFCAARQAAVQKPIRTLPLLLYFVCCSRGLIGLLPARPDGCLHRNTAVVMTLYST